MSAGTRHYAADQPVPERWAEFSFEYRHGYGWGLSGTKWVRNPVRGSIADGRARDAWAAGRRKGLRDRRRGMRNLADGDVLVERHP